MNRTTILFKARTGRGSLSLTLALVVLIIIHMATTSSGQSANQSIATFSIVAHDSVTGELGVAVASRFFTVGNVVPWAKAGVGAIATQAYANTSFGWRGLELLEKGLTPEEVRDVLIRQDDDPQRRQMGIVSADGKSATYTGDGCTAWAGGRSGPHYAVQGNILASETVVIAMERAFLETGGTLADRLYSALLAGENAGGDSRGKQSAALLVVKEGTGYGGYTDRAIDVRVDDHPEPFEELGRILRIAQMNYAWNEAWTLFTQGKYAEALPPMRRTVALAPDYGEVHYDLACILLANMDRQGALSALKTAFGLDPKLVNQANNDDDLKELRGDVEFERLTRSENR